MFRFLIEAHRRSEFVTKLFFVYVIPIYFSGCMILLSVNASICYIVLGGLETQCFETSYQTMYWSNISFYGTLNQIIPRLTFKIIFTNICRVFWDSGTILGKFGETFVCIYTASIFLVVNNAFLVLFIAICEHCRAFYKQFHWLSKRLDPNQATQSLRDLIKFHYSAKE